MQPFSPLTIVALFALGLTLAVVAFLRQPGAPLVFNHGASTAQALEPLKLSDPNLKLYRN